MGRRRNCMIDIPTTLKDAGCRNAKTSCVQLPFHHARFSVEISRYTPLASS